MSEEISTQVLKVDEAGRVQTPRAKREEIVTAYESSGITGRQFATYCGVRYSTLMCWGKRYRKKKRATETDVVVGKSRRCVNIGTVRTPRSDGYAKSAAGLPSCVIRDAYIDRTKGRNRSNTRN